MSDDEIREIHGVMYCSNAVYIREESIFIFLQTPVSGLSMPPKQARYLASKLNRLARRIEARKADAIDLKERKP